MEFYKMHNKVEKRSPYKVLSSELPLINFDILNDIERSFAEILRDNWEYFSKSNKMENEREFVCIDNYRVCKADAIINFDYVYLLIRTEKGEDIEQYGILADLRCFTDENFLKEKMND